MHDLVIPIETVVAKATAAPARLFELAGRATLELGKRAEINVVDLDRLRIEQATDHRVLPAGGQRFAQPASGYLATLVHGVQTRGRHEDTGARPARLARQQPRRWAGRRPEIPIMHPGLDRTKFKSTVEPASRLG